MEEGLREIAMDLQVDLAVDLVVVEAQVEAMVEDQPVVGMEVLDVEVVAAVVEDPLGEATVEGALMEEGIVVDHLPGVIMAHLVALAVGAVVVEEVDPLVEIMEEDHPGTIMDLEDQVAGEEDVEDLLEGAVMVSKVTKIKKRNILIFIKLYSRYVVQLLYCFCYRLVISFLSKRKYFFILSCTQSIQFTDLLHSRIIIWKRILST